MNDSTPSNFNLPQRTQAERVAAWCNWFGHDLPPLAFDDDEPDALLLTDDLLKWAHESGASLDWVILGDAKNLAHAFHEKHASTRRLADMVVQLDDWEQAGLLDALRKGTDGDFHESMQAFIAEALARRRRLAGEIAG